MKKRFLSLSVCMVLLLTMTSCSAADVPTASGEIETNSTKAVSESQPVSTFSDVPADAWYAEAVTYCKANGIMGGTSATTFAPEATLTRAMLATVLHRMSDTPAVSDPLVFIDAAAGSWYSDAVAWAAKTGVIEGCGGVYPQSHTAPASALCPVGWSGRMTRTAWIGTEKATGGNWITSTRR